MNCIFETDDKYDYIYHGAREPLCDGMKTVYEDGPECDRLTVYTTNAVMKTSGITRDSYIEKGDTFDLYSQVYNVTSARGNVRYIRSGIKPVAKLVYVDSLEYHWYGNPFFMTQIDSDHVSVKKDNGKFMFYDGGKIIGETECEPKKTTEESSLCARFNKAALPFAHLFILPIYELVFKPNEKRADSASEMEYLFKMTNEAGYEVLKKMKGIKETVISLDEEGNEERESRPINISDYLVMPSPSILTAAELRGKSPEEILEISNIESTRETILGLDMTTKRR